MSILITGGAGNIGRYLLRALLKRGYNQLVVYDAVSQEAVLKLNRWLEQFNENGEVVVERGDITNVSRLLEVVIKHKCKDIFHLAALLSSESEEAPVFAFEVNVRGTLNVLEAARICGTGKVIFGSTISTFGPDVPEPVDEDAAQHPTSFYGITKVIGELLGNYYSARFGIDFRALRFPRIVNPGRAGTGAAAYPGALIENVGRGKKHIERLKPEYTVPIIYIKEAVDLLVGLYEASALSRRVYNVQGLVFSLRELVETIKKLKPEAEVEICSEATGGASHLIIPMWYQSERLYQDIGDVKKYTLEELIEDFWLEIKQEVR